MRIKKTVHGRSMIKNLLLNGILIEELINQLISKNWEKSKLTKAAMITYNDCKLDMIFDDIKEKSESEIIVIIRNHILDLFDEQVGSVFAGIYLIGFVKLNNPNDDIYTLVKEKFNKEKKKYHHKQIKKIIMHSVKNGKFLNLLNADGSVSDTKFFLNWGYYQEDILLKDIISLIKNTLENENDIEWYNELYQNRHVLKNDILKAINFNFSMPIVTHKKIKKDEKIRKVYMVEKLSREYVVMKYIKKKMDLEFGIRYTDRNSIMRELFALLNDINNLTNYTIVRFDIKDFFESVETNFIFDTYIKMSNLDKHIKLLLEQIKDNNSKCHAGIPISNALLEIAGKCFDNSLRAELRSSGLIFYSRYVDDGLIIFNRGVKKEYVYDTIEECLKKYFGDSVELHRQKRNYLTKVDGDTEFSYLGYLFQRKDNHYLYGITEEKRNKYQKKIDSIIDDYLVNKNQELLRQRIIYFISRVVFYNKYTVESIRGSWEVVGISANYCLLKEAIIRDKVESRTSKFLKNVIFSTLMRKTRGKTCYFINSKTKANYSIWNSIEKNKAIVFHSKIGWSIEFLRKQIEKLGYKNQLANKSYRECVAIYCSLIKLQG